MLKIKSWRIYYADGSTFDSTMGKWADAPPFGVQCIVYYHPDGWKTIQSEADDKSVYTFLGEEELDGVKMGLWMDSNGYYRIIDLANKSSSP
jgi:hypothetical protein